MEFNKGSISVQRWPCPHQDEVASLQKTKVQQTKQTMKKNLTEKNVSKNVSVQRRASGAQALAAKRKTKSRSQKFHCYRAFEKETIGMVYNPKICPKIYEDGLVSGDRWDVRHCFQKVFIFSKAIFDPLQEFFFCRPRSDLENIEAFEEKRKQIWVEEKKGWCFSYF